MSITKLRGHFHCKYDIHYHLVLVTKYRRKCFDSEMLELLREIFSELCTRWDCKLEEFNGEADHVHLLISAHPSMNLSVFVNNLKTVSSRLTRGRFKEKLRKFYWKPVLWTRAYCLVSAGGAPLEIIKRYIENQGNHE